MTGGGGNTAIKASSICVNCWFNVPAIANAERLVSRSENGFKVTKTIPELELFVKPLTDNPGKATALSAPA
jgi:hypothetical protein